MKTKERKNLINRWHLVVLVGILAFLIVGSCYIYYQTELKNIRNEKYEELKAIADLKISQILQWRVDRIQDANSAQSVFFGKAITEYALDNSDKILEKNLLLRLLQYEKQYKYEDAFLLDKNMKMLLTADYELTNLDKNTLQNCIQAAEIRKTICSDIYYNSERKKALIEIVTPVYKNTDLVAFMVLQNNPESFLFPLVQSWPTPSKTAETVLIKRDGDDLLFINDVRHVKNTALRLRIPLTTTKIAGVQAILGKRGVSESEDYRGIKVIADLRSIPGTNWFMITKMDKSELFKDLNTMTSMMILFLVIILLLLAAGLTMIFRFRQHNIYSELNKAESELRQTEKELQATLLNIGDAVISSSLENKIQSMNPMAEKLTGWEEKEAIGKPINEVFHLINGENRLSVENVIDELLNRKKSGNLSDQLVMVSNRNEEIPVSLSIASLSDFDREHKGYMIVFRDETDEYEAELKLKYSEEMLSNLFQLGPFPTALVRLSDQKIMDVNLSYTELYGFSKDEIIGKSILEIGRWNDPLKQSEFLDRLQNQENIDNLEFDFRLKSGELRKGMITTRKIDFHHEKYVVGRIQDITDQWLAESALKDREEQYRSLFESMLNGYAYCHAIYEDGIPVDFEFLKVNKALETLTGIKDVEGHKISEFLPTLRESDPELFDFYKAFIANNEPARFEYFMNSMGQWFVFTVYSHRKDYFVVIFDVITERKKTEQALIESENRFRSTLDNMMEGCQIIDFDWKYFYMNTAAANFGKLRKGEMIGKKVTDFYPDFESTDMFKALKKCMNERISLRQEFYFKHPDGSDAWFDFSIQPVPEGIFILSLDVSERRLAQEELRLMNKELDNRVKERTIQLESANQELESFSYSVSHDLRAPLRHIAGYSQILTNDFKADLPEKAQNYLSTIVQVVKTMSTLIDDLLQFSRTGRTELKKLVFSMDQLLNEAMTPIIQALEDRNIEWDIQSLPKINGDYNLLKQVWSNLLSNAVKYSRDRSPAKIRIGCIKKQDENVFFIADNGVGFEMKYADKLFGVFQRLHSVEQFEGTGIGLANVRRIIARHGGRTWADSKLNEGATFYFSLPREI
ncbi:MAG: PAS domain S-box protein [Bacteroidetes bacterium]|nr:PAS domain S-box protein [Bacteroidota bacterium]